MLGRRKCIMAGCIILSIGAALQCSAYGIPQLIVGRIIAGVGNGLNTSTIRELLLSRGCFSEPTDICPLF
jgi:MFS family permease